MRTLCKHIGRAIETIELEFHVMRWISIVVPHPLDKLSIRFELSETVPKSSILHCLIGCRAAAKHVFVDDGSPRKTALNGNGAVAMGFDKALEEVVAKDKQLFPSMKCFSKAKQCYLCAKCADHCINDGVEIRARIERAWDRLVCHPVVECRIYSCCMRHESTLRYFHCTIHLMRNLLLLLNLTPMHSSTVWEHGQVRTRSRLRQIEHSAACMHLRSKLARLFLDHVSTIQPRCNI